MAVFIAGLIGIIVFYLAILGVGIWASRMAKDDSEEELMLAGRSLGFVVGALTLIATWVGGGYINGAAEVMFDKGLLWAQVPTGYSIALFVGALFFVKPMRDLRCVTLLDPFQRLYGDRVGGLLVVPCIFGDFFWVGSILNALGSSLVVITDIDSVLAVAISAIFVAAYTSVGAMYSVTYTDVVQIFFILFGLVLAAPFVATSQYVDSNNLNTNPDWLGTIKNEDIGEWIDTMLLLILGGIPWQGYMQRILAIKSTKSAQRLCVASMFGCMLMAIPPAFIGLTARSVNWKEVPGFARDTTEKDAAIMLPLTLRYITPEWVAFFGLGAISAAVMSSADSSVLAFSAMFSRNMYKNIFRSNASEREIVWVLRATILIISLLSTVIALTVPSIYYLSILSSDLIYVILFPQLLLILYWTNGVNSYGCLASYFVGAVVRVLGGEHGIGLPAVIEYPNFDYKNMKQRFPHRTLAMLVSLFTHLIVSCCANLLFKRGIIPPRYDFLKFYDFENPTESEGIVMASIPVVSQKNEEKLLMTSRASTHKESVSKRKIRPVESKKVMDKVEYTDDSPSVEKSKKKQGISTEKNQFSSDNDLMR